MNPTLREGILSLLVFFYLNNVISRTISIGRWKNTNLVAEKDYAIGTFSTGDFCLVDESQTKIRFICSKDEVVCIYCY